LFLIEPKSWAHFVTFENNTKAEGEEQKEKDKDSMIDKQLRTADYSRLQIRVSHHFILKSSSKAELHKFISKVANSNRLQVLNSLTTYDIDSYEVQNSSNYLEKYDTDQSLRCLNWEQRYALEGWFQNGLLPFLWLQQIMYLFVFMLREKRRKIIQSFEKRSLFPSTSSFFPAINIAEWERFVIDNDVVLSYAAMDKFSTIFYNIANSCDPAQSAPEIWWYSLYGPYLYQGPSDTVYQGYSYQSYEPFGSLPDFIELHKENIYFPQSEDPFDSHADDDDDLTRYLYYYFIYSPLIIILVDYMMMMCTSLWVGEIEIRRKFR
jgi:hypothetical protein